MAEWKRVKLSELGEIVGGATPSTSHEEYYNGNIPWLTPKDLAGYKSRYIKSGERNITKAGLDSCAAKIMPKNTVLFSSRAPIGYIAIAENDICTNQGFKSIVPNDSIAPLFLYYLLKSNKNRIEAVGSGTTFKEVSGKTMGAVTVKIPVEKKIQEKIASVLDSLDSKIELNSKINDNLEQQLEAVYQGTVKATDSPYDLVTLDEWCHIFTGKKNANQFDEDGQYMFFTCGEKPLRINSYIYDGPAIIISGNGSYTGRTIFYNGKFDLYQRTYACTMKENVPSDFIFGLYAILKMELHAKIAGGTHGSSIPYIVMNDLAKFEFPYNHSEFSEFSKHAKTLLTVIQHNRQQNEVLSQIRDTLLPKLMSGEIDVPDIEI